MVGSTSGMAEYWNLVQASRGNIGRLSVTTVSRPSRKLTTGHPCVKASGQMSLIQSHCPIARQDDD